MSENVKACVQCGRCCEEYLCVWGAVKHGMGNEIGPVRGPCPSLLRQEDGRRLCAIMLEPNRFYTCEIIQRLDAGKGCHKNVALMKAKQA